MESFPYADYVNPRAATGRARGKQLRIYQRQYLCTIQGAVVDAHIIFDHDSAAGVVPRSSEVQIIIVRTDITRNASCRKGITVQIKRFGHTVEGAGQMVPGIVVDRGSGNRNIV